MAADWHGTQRIPLQISGGIAIASIQTDLTDDVLNRFRDDLLQFIQAHGCRGLVLDFSGIDIVDATEFSELRRILDMASLLGARPMLSGLSPGIIAALIDADADIDGIAGVLHVDDALTELRGDTQRALNHAAPETPPVEGETDGNAG